MITKLRDDFKVNIQLPKKEGDSQEEITITGLEENAEAAKNEILKIVGQYESMVKMEVNIDAKVHSMIIGRGGKSIRNIMEKYKVDIRLPRAGDEDPSLVLVSGNQDACEDCIDHLKIMQEDFIQEAAEQVWERDYMKPTRQVENKESNKKKDGFMVSKAPWDVSSSEAFPSLGGGGGGKLNRNLFPAPSDPCQFIVSSPSTQSSFIYSSIQSRWSLLCPHSLGSKEWTSLGQKNKQILRRPRTSDASSNIENIKGGSEANPLVSHTRPQHLAAQLINKNNHI